MSEPKLISPLLDGFVVGEPMSNHHGIRCCPALKEATDERHIVKIVSIPPSQTQMDALLLSGAYDSKEKAMEYFRAQADGIETEIQLLKKLSNLEGYHAFDGYQVIELPNYAGLLVCLLNPYYCSLEKQMKREPLTLLSAVNLGLDMCAALTAARRAGYLYIDLKPSNIYHTENSGFCIGDLGFIPLDSLKYASLPDKYRSSYTAPEVFDAFSALNDKLDIYALGLVLYQVYNNGDLPFSGTAPSEQLPAPLYADYEMAEIILKACSPDPAQRWDDPAQMGQELVNYMQRNYINDDPIVPAPPAPPVKEDLTPEDFLTEDENEAELAALLSMIPDEELPHDNEVVTSTQSADLHDAVEEEFTKMETMDNDDTTDVAQMLAQADELLALELPEPVVAPAPIDVPIPPPIISEPELNTVSIDESPLPPETCEEQDSESDEIPTPGSEDEPVEEESNDETVENPEPKKRRPVLLWIGIAAIIVLLVATVCIGYHHYNHKYLQTIDGLEINGNKNEITVCINSDIDEELLTVICSDNYGNAIHSAVTEHVATFTNLNPSTQYKIQVVISGTHKLLGPTTGTYTTAAETQIHNFSVITGNADGSAMLSFTVSGPDSEVWFLDYSAGEITKTLEFRGHNVDVSGLAVGTEYTFTLRPKQELYLTGEMTISHTAAKLILAQNLRLASYKEGAISIAWEATEGIKWTVHCKNDRGYEKTLTTDTPIAEFSDLDTTCPYLITVTAEGMSQSQSLTIGANPINITGYTSNPLSPWLVELTWEYTGPAPTNGWELCYTMSDGVKISRICSDNKAQIHFLPGSSYLFTVTPLHEGPGFGLTFSHTAVTTAPFPGIGENAAVSLYAIPAIENWTIADLEESKTVFAPEEGACLLLTPVELYEEETVNISFVITGADNTLISESIDTYPWASLIDENQVLIPIPALPTTLGNYTLAIYMNDQLVIATDFEIQPAADAAG